MKNILLITSLLVLSFGSACNPNQQKKLKEKRHHHTSKVSGYINISFLSKDYIKFIISDEVTDVNIKVFHKNSTSKRIIFQANESLKKLSLLGLNDGVSSGYLFAVVSGKVNGQDFSNSANYKLNDQEQIDFESQKLKIRSSEYESE